MVLKTFTLKRTEAAEDGIWGVLLDEHGETFACTLEHAYSVPKGYMAKLPAGQYVLTLGTHQLEHGGPFPAYAVSPFVGWDGATHTDVLIHPGNLQDDSKGCIFVGGWQGMLDGQRAVLSSRVTFIKFMTYAKDPQIGLIVEDAQ